MLAVNPVLLPQGQQPQPAQPAGPQQAQDAAKKGVEEGKVAVRRQKDLVVEFQGHEFFLKDQQNQLLIKLKEKGVGLVRYCWDLATKDRWRKAASLGFAVAALNPLRQAGLGPVGTLAAEATKLGCKVTAHFLERGAAPLIDSISGTLGFLTSEPAIGKAAFVGGAACLGWSLAKPHWNETREYVKKHPWISLRKAVVLTTTAATLESYFGLFSAAAWVTEKTAISITNAIFPGTFSNPVATLAKVLAGTSLSLLGAALAVQGDANAFCKKGHRYAAGFAAAAAASAAIFGAAAPLTISFALNSCISVGGKLADYFEIFKEILLAEPVL